MSVATPANPDPALLTDRAPSVGRLFLDRVQQSPELEAYRYPVAEDWESVTWAQTGDRVSRLAAGLVALGVAPEERVAIAATTRYEWILADLAILCAGAATTTVYPTTLAGDVAYIVSDSDSRVVFAEDDEQIAKLREHRAELPAVSKVVTFDGTPDGDWVISLEDLEKLGEQRLAETPDVITERVDGAQPGSLATLIYTSGTTGRPKGVRLTHSAMTYEAAAIDVMKVLSTDDLQFLWLPMSHVFGTVLLMVQLQIGFPTAVDGRVPKIVDNLAVVRPTFMGAAPRIFEKAHARVTTMAEGEGGLKAKIFGWAFGVGTKVSQLQRAGKDVPALLGVQHKIADALVFSKIRDRFGGRVRFFISGAAALNKELAEWFHAAGILILEGYGLTENCAGACLNRPDNFKLGTVGPPFPGTEIKIASDGEVLIKGPQVMEGYHGMPEQTAEALSTDGWLHTGDIGELDGDGFLRITDRKKDLFKTSGGKYVAPSLIEGQFKNICPYASQIVVHGNERNYCTALVTLDPDAIVPWAEQHGLAGSSYSEIVSSPEARELVAGYVAELNTQLNRWETIKKFAILEQDLSVEGGEMTPSLKVKRKVVEDKYRDKLDALYS
ncbi:MAG: AMP-dependent synthetase/ligase [Micromonosporaceae bacterium]